MKKINMIREIPLNESFAMKVDQLFEFVSYAIEEDGVFKKNTLKLSFSREEKLKLFEFFQNTGFPYARQINLNESTREDFYVSPFEIMDLLRKHR